MSAPITPERLAGMWTRWQAGVMLPTQDVDALLREVERLRVELSDALAALADKDAAVDAQIATLEAQVTRLREALSTLRPFARHFPDCASRHPLSDVCSCGLDTAHRAAGG